MSETTPKADDGTGRVVKTENVLGGKPRVEGRRIGVRFLREQVEGVASTRKMSPLGSTST